MYVSVRFLSFMLLIGICTATLNLGGIRACDSGNIAGLVIQNCTCKGCGSCSSRKRTDQFRIHYMLSVLWFMMGLTPIVSVKRRVEQKSFSSGMKLGLLAKFK